MIFGKAFAVNASIGSSAVTSSITENRQDGVGTRWGPTIMDLSTDIHEPASGSP